MKPTFIRKKAAEFEKISRVASAQRKLVYGALILLATLFAAQGFLRSTRDLYFLNKRGVETVAKVLAYQPRHMKHLYKVLYEGRYGALDLGRPDAPIHDIIPVVYDPQEPRRVQYGDLGPGDGHIFRRYWNSRTRFYLALFAGLFLWAVAFFARGIIGLLENQTSRRG